MTTINDGYTLVSKSGIYTPIGISPVYNVKNFGAKGDGSTDDTTAIQSVLNLVGGRSNTGQISVSAIYFPSGTYKITSTLTLIGPSNGQRGIKIFGDTVGFSEGATTIQWHGSAGGTLFQSQGICNSSIEGLVFDGNETAGICYWYRSDQPNGGSGSSGNRFSHCYFIGATGGVSGDGYYSSCFLTGSITDGYSNQIDTTSWEFCYFYGNTVPNTTYCFAQLEGSNQKNYRFFNCVFLNAQEAIRMAISGYNLFDTCTVSNFSVYGYHFATGSGQAEIIGNSTENNWVTLGAASAPPFLYAPAQCIVAIRGSYIINQMCKADGTPGSTNSIQLSAQSLILENNIIDGTLNSGGASGACSGIAIVAAIGAGTSRGTGLRSCNNQWVTGTLVPQIQVFINGNQCLDFTSTVENAIANQITTDGDLIIGLSSTIVSKSIRGDAQQNARAALTSNSQTSGVLTNYRGESRVHTEDFEVDYTVLKNTSQNVLLGNIQPRQNLLRVLVEVVTGLTSVGGALTDGYVVLGKGSPGDTTYFTSQSVFTSGTVFGNYSIAFDGSSWLSGNTIWAQFSFTGDVRTNLNGGKIKFYITSEFVGE
jgi:hypothetical protein